MADKLISSLTATTTLADADLLVTEIASSGNSRKITKANLGLAIGARGALVRKSVDQTAANYTTATAVAWDQENYDTDTIHDNSVANTRLTVPTGVTKVRVSGQIVLASATANEFMQLQIQKGGTASYDGAASLITSANVTTPMGNLSTPILTVSATEYFELFLRVAADTSITVTAATSWFAMEIIG